MNTERDLQAVKDALESGDVINAACAANRVAEAISEGSCSPGEPVTLTEGHGTSTQPLEGVLVRLLRMAILGEAKRNASFAPEDAARLVTERRGTPRNRPDSSYRVG